MFLVEDIYRYDGDLSWIIIRNVIACRKRGFFFVVFISIVLSRRFRRIVLAKAVSACRLS